MNHIQLTSQELEYLKRFTSSGTQNVREVNRAYMLLWLHKGMKMADIEEFLGVDRTAIWRTKKKYQLKGVEYAIKDLERPGQPVKYKSRQHAEIIALACSDPPQGRERWTLELLTNESQKIQGLETISRESIRLVLKKTNVNLG
jgi:putative transposase